MARVGIWIRVSTEEQAAGESPSHHRKRAEAYVASKRNWHVASIYDLAGVSGKSVLEHHEAQRMMRDVASGEITVLIFQSSPASLVTYVSSWKYRSTLNGMERPS